MNQSTYDYLGWPIQVTVLFVTLGLIATIAPYLSEVKLGGWEIPDFGSRAKRVLMVAGPVFLGIILFGYFPCWSTGETIDFDDYNAGGFHISEKQLSVDLALRQRVGQDTRQKTKVSPAKWVTILKVKKSAEAPKQFFKEFWTSGLAPDVICFSHPFEFKELPYDPSPGRENMRRYGLFVDVSAEEANVEFELHYQYIFWNSFQGETEEWAAAPTKHAADKLVFTVYSPRGKPFKKHDLYFYPTVNPDLEKFTDDPDFQFSSERMTWTIANPKINHSYRIVWEW